jgi:hypothetical protein
MGEESDVNFGLTDFYVGGPAAGGRTGGGTLAGLKWKTATQQWLPGWRSKNVTILIE